MKSHAPFRSNPSRREGKPKSMWVFPSCCFPSQPVPAILSFSYSTLLTPLEYGDLKGPTSE